MQNGKENFTRAIDFTGPEHCPSLVSVDFNFLCEKDNKKHDTIKTTYANIDYAAFTSSSAVQWFAQSAENVNFSNIKAVCIGERTAATARSFGMQIYIAGSATIESMVNTIKELCVYGY